MKNTNEYESLVASIITRLLFGVLMLTSQLTAAINGHFQLADTAIWNDWYNAYGNPEEQLNTVSKEVDSFLFIF